MFKEPAGGDRSADAARQRADELCTAFGGNQDTNGRPQKGSRSQRERERLPPIPSASPIPKASPIPPASPMPKASMTKSDKWPT